MPYEVIDAPTLADGIPVAERRTEHKQTVILDDELKSRLRLAAAVTGMSEASLMRRALRSHLYGLEHRPDLRRKYEELAADGAARTCEGEG